MIKIRLQLLICLNWILLFTATAGDNSIHGGGESGCRVLLDKYFDSVRNDKINNKIEYLINEACLGISEADKENPFVCGMMGVREKKRGPLEAIEKCVDKYKGKWGRYM